MWILRPIYRLECQGLRQFVLRILAQQFAIKILVAIAVVSVLPHARAADRSATLRDPGSAFLLFVVIAPVVETILLQAVPIELLRATRRPKWLQFLSGWLPFAALHFPLGVAPGIAAGVVGGAFFTHAYLECRTSSLWTSVAITAITHSLHNLIVFPILLLMAGSTVG